MQKLTIFIVDDSPVMCRFLALFLEKKYEVISFSDSTEALQSIQNREYQPVAIVTDLDMPNLSGLEFIQGVRQVHATTPILVVSGMKESETRIKSLEMGADDFITKPFHPAELDTRIGKLILRNQAQHEEAKVVKLDSVFKGFIKAATF